MKACLLLTVAVIGLSFQKNLKKQCTIIYKQSKAHFLHVL